VSSTSAQPHKRFLPLLSDCGFLLLYIISACISIPASYVAFAFHDCSRCCINTLCSKTQPDFAYSGSSQPYQLLYLDSATMEVVASGMAVASLSIQLIQSIDAIQTFITNFKDAPKELQRLTGLLERLNSILQDVHNITEQQTSLNNQHFPLPSTTIFHCLQGCEQSLLPLQAEVESYKQYQTPKNSRVAAMKGNFMMSWRAKEIAGFEVAIQREIDFLQAALAVNSHTIS
jgi:hypothetical protein